MKTKNLNILIFGLVIKFSILNAQSFINPNPQVDSVFAYHFHILDSANETLKKASLDSLLFEKILDTTNTLRVPNYNLSIDFLEKVSEIHGTYILNYSPIKILDDCIINEWKIWYKKNYSTLIWMRKERRVNRKDKDIYSSGLSPK